MKIMGCESIGKGNRINQTQTWKDKSWSVNFKTQLRVSLSVICYFGYFIW